MTETGAASADAPHRARNRLSYVWLAAAVFVLHAALSAGHLLSPDGELLYRQAESMALSGRIDVRPLEYNEEMRQLLVPAEAAFAVVEGPSGRFHPQYLPLQPILSVPVLWIAEATRPLLGDWFASTLPGTDRHPVVEAHKAWRRGLLVMVFNPLVAALTAVLLARIVMMMTECRRGAIWTAALWAFGTMAWPHSRTYFTEPLAGLLALLAFERLLRWWSAAEEGDTARRRRISLQFGAALALGMAVRMDSPLIAFGFGVTLVLVGEYKRLLMSARGDRPPSGFFIDYVSAGAIVVAGWLIVLLYNDLRFTGLQAVRSLDIVALVTGGYADQAEGVQFSTPILVGLHGYLFSPGRGMFFFSPALLLALWGWTKTPKHLRWAGWALTLGFLPFALAMIKWQNWDGGWCWGPRHIYQLHAPLMIGAAFLFIGAEGWSPIRNGVIKAIAVVATAVQLYGSSQSSLDFYHELYQTTADGEYYSIAYRPFEFPVVASEFSVTARQPTGDPGPEVFPSLLPAPLVDSLYIPNHTQWTGNALMWKLGYRDLLLWRIVTGQGYRDSIQTLGTTERDGD